MMFGDKYILAIMPQHLNNIPESNLTEEMVNTAISKGYTVNKHTPAHLFKYNQIINLILTTGQYQLFNEENFSYVKNSSLFPDVVRLIVSKLSFYHENYKSYLTEGVRYIEPNEHNIVIINNGLLIPYIQQFPEFLYNDLLNFNQGYYYSDESYEQIYAVIEANNLDYTKITRMNSKLFTTILKHDSSILTKERVENFGNTSELESIIAEKFYARTLSAAQIAETFIANNDGYDGFYKNLLLDDNIENAKYFKLTEQELVKIFFSNFEKNMEHLGPFSKMVKDYYLSTEQKDQITNYILEHNLVINEVDWYFITSNQDIALNSIRKDPNVLNTVKDFNLYLLTQEELDEIYNLIVSHHLIVTNYHYFLMNDERIGTYIFEHNPYIVNSYSSFFPPYLEKLIKQHQDLYELSSQNDTTLATYVGYEETLHRHPSYLEHNNNILPKQAEKVYQLLLETSSIPHNNDTFTRSTIGLLDALRSNSIELSDYRFNNVYSDDKDHGTYADLANYIYSNYTDIPETITSRFNASFVNTSNFQIILTDLQQDFSNILKYGSDISSQYYQTLENHAEEISNLYFQNYEQNKYLLDICNIISKNPHIIERELLEHNRSIKNHQYDLRVINTYSRMVKEGKVQVTDETARLLSDIDVICAVVKETPYRYNLIDTTLLEVEDLKKLDEVLKQEIIAGRFELNPSNYNFIIRNIDFSLQYLNPLNIMTALNNAREHYDINQIHNIADDLFDCYPIQTTGLVLSILSPTKATSILEANPHLLQNINPRNKNSYYSYGYDYDDSIITLKTNLRQKENLHLYRYNPNYEYTPEELTNFLNNNYQDCHLIQTLFKNNKITPEQFDYYNNKAVTDFLNHTFTGVDYPSIFDSHNNLISNYAKFLCNQDPIEYLEQCDEHKIEPTYLYEEYPHLNITNKISLVSYIAYIPNLKPIILNNEINEILLKHMATNHAFTPEEVYNAWVKIGKPTNIPNIYYNPLILREIISTLSSTRLDDLALDEKYNDIIYDYFKNTDLTTIVNQMFFLNNSKLIALYLGKEIPSNYEIGSNEHLELLTELIIKLNNIPNYSNIIRTSYWTDLLNNLVNKNYPLTIELSTNQELQAKLLGDNYILNENSPFTLFTNQDLVLNTLEKHPENYKIIFSRMKYINDYYLPKTLAEYAISHNLYGLINDYTLNNPEYIENSINQDPSCIDNMNVGRLTSEKGILLQRLILKQIEEGKYKLNINTPIFLLYNEKIYRLAKETCPELAANSPLAKYETNKPDLINEAIQNPSRTNELLQDRFYPEDKINELVNILIVNNYIVDNNTPVCLLYNPKLIEYALKNNMSVQSKYLESFTTLENLHLLKDTALFISLIKQGYGKQFIPFIAKMGEKEALELAIKYGRTLLTVPISEFKNEEEFLLKSSTCYFDDYMHYEIFLRSNYSPTFITNLESYKKDNLLSLMFKDFYKNKANIKTILNNGGVIPLGPEHKDDKEIFDFLIKEAKNPHQLVGCIDNFNPNFLTEEIILTAIKNGYKITEKTPSIVTTNPRCLDEYLRIHHRDLNDILELLKDNLNDEIIKVFIKHGYTPLKYNEYPIICENPLYIQMMIQTKPLRLNSIIDYTPLKLEEYITPDKVKEYFIKYFNTQTEPVNIDKLSPADIFHKFNKMRSDRKELNDGVFRQYVSFVFGDLLISDEDMDEALRFIKKIQYSNSSEIRHFASEIVRELLKLKDRDLAYHKIENIFLHNNLPMVGKIFDVFKVLHEDYKAFDKYERMSPVLKKHGKNYRDVIIFNDLLRAAITSNNRSLKEYLQNIKKSSPLLEKVYRGEIKIEDLSEEELNLLTNFVSHLFTLFANTKYERGKTIVIEPTGNLLEDIKTIKTLLKPEKTNNNDYDISDRVIRMFCYYAGFNTVDDLMKVISESKDRTTARNIDASTKPFTLEKGDYVKGIDGGIRYIGNILQNGSLSKEFLGDSAGSDATPLDTDCSRINQVGDSISATLNNLEASSYGNIWIVIKNNPNKISITRERQETPDGEQIIESAAYDRTKTEAFYTGVVGHTHYGIRTGFGSEDIDYFLVKELTPALKFEIALNGFYIPVVDVKTEELIFTYEDYLELRKKMSGIPSLETGEYLIATQDELVTPKVLEMAKSIPENKAKIQAKHQAIKQALAAKAASLGYSLHDGLSKDISNGTIDLIDTGSTARGTDVPGKADFDYICRIDKELITNPEKFANFRQTLESAFESIEKKEYADNGNFRFKGVKVPGLDELVDIDVSFIVKTNKIELSSDDSLQEKLRSIKEGNTTGKEAPNPSKYSLVLSNIILAKKLMKKFECYKNHRNPETPQGGLGGIGIENWILQNGGSLRNAALEFDQVAREYPNWDDFKNHYFIWDAGSNHYAFERDSYSHDNFVYDNMDANGFNKMKIAVAAYLKYGDKVFEEEFKPSEIVEYLQAEEHTKAM